ncbi:hypothetical protein RX327_31240 [Bradyrhizobium sp. BEA-2-5]|uniref:hypothetical protein n=1 Tax=Bradyrhizobium sp. BEA-2-5 TaxID=3080015 RepID=UPI00293E53C9|nr:hypothetical protein [Bradyrhizobium sp. BEA-2-5]WOH80253.1 hypothetical protein RX327_31240 [Bradyrhizobium sp. BEA-2-5]
MVNKVGGSGSHGSDTADVSADKAGNKADKGAGGGGTTASTAASGAGAVIDQAGAAGTYEAVIAQLKAVSLQTMVQDMRLRTLSTELASEKKAASERANG